MRWAQVATIGLMCVIADTAALASNPFILVTGRRDPRIYAIDLTAALRTRAVVATVTGVGIDPYGLTIVDDQ